MTSCSLAFGSVVIQAESKVEVACVLVCAQHLALQLSPSNAAEDVIARDNTFLHGFAARWLERAGEVLFPDELAGLDTRDLFLTLFPLPSGHACVYSYLSALNL